ncbi:Fc.00g033590.m01.CDS01 [Cosmosporella sp. VM-42]
MSDTGVEVDLAIGPPSGPQGYICWDASQCKLCSRFRDPETILQLFLKRFVILGKTMDLLNWSQEGQRCMLCVYIVLEFIEELGGPDNFVTDANFIVRWSFDQQPDVGFSQITTFEFEMSWGFPQMRARNIMMNAFTLKEEDTAACIAFRPPNPVVASPAAFDMARDWIETCDDYHTACSAKAPATLPSRVLEISRAATENIRVRLRETNGEEGKYAALSYVWGDPQNQYTTRHENLSRHLIDIPVSSLPLTVADAVLCVHQLGLSYLWVDALCIVQDDLEDKSQEVANMARIYTNAYVTISAAKASGASEGFSKPRPALQNLLGFCFNLEMTVPKDVKELLLWVDGHRHNPEYSKLSYRDEVEMLFEQTPWYVDRDTWAGSSSTFWIAGRPTREGGDLVTAPRIDREPISRRGWTLQESWLSRRMLIYGSRQVVWRCRESSKADGGQAPYQIRQQHDFESPVDSSSRLSFRHGWRTLLSDFASRQLGDPTDKLNALQGIVEDLEDQTGDEYLAGLWRSDMIGGLSWYQDMTNKGAEEILLNPDRTCPSWSWAKVDGPLAFSIAENVTAKVERAIVTKSEVTGESPWATRLVVEGEITLRAPIACLPALELLGHFKWLSPDSSPQAFSNHIYLDGGLSNSDFEIGVVNGESTIGCPDDLKFMELSRGKWDGRQNLAAESRGLILVPVRGRPNTYRRAGFFIVALEYDVDAVAGGQNMLLCLSVEEANVRPTAFGEMWTDCLEEDVATLI